MVGTAALGDWSVTIAVKPWVSVQQFGPATSEINRAILDIFRNRGLSCRYRSGKSVLGNGAAPQNA